jgi:hypothetical protein
MYETAAIAKRITRASLMCGPMRGNIDSRRQIRPKPTVSTKTTWVERPAKCYHRLKPALTVTLEDATAACASTQQKTKQPAK